MLLTDRRATVRLLQELFPIRGKLDSGIIQNACALTWLYLSTAARDHSLCETGDTGLDLPVAVLLGKTLPLVKWFIRKCETSAGFVDRCFILNLVLCNGILAIHPKSESFYAVFPNTWVNQTTISRKPSETRPKVINQSFVAIPVNYRRRCRWGGGAVVPFTIRRALSNSATTKAGVLSTKMPKLDEPRRKIFSKMVQRLLEQ